MKIAVFPGSFDPFTLGHLDVLKSALCLFDKVIVAIGKNVTKKGFYDIETRIDIIKKSVEGLQNVEVCAYDGMTIDFAKKIGASCIVRGIRTTTDFELESVIAQVNKSICPEVQSIFIPTSHEYSFISSTVVRDIIVNGGDASEFMSKNVKLDIYKVN